MTAAVGVDALGDAPASSSARGRAGLAWAGAGVAMVVGTLLWAGLVTRILGPVGGHSDYRTHARLAKGLLYGRPVDLPHPLYHWLVTGIHRLNPAWGLGEAGVVLVLICQAVLLVMMYRLLDGASSDPRTPRLAALLAGLTVALTFVNPLNQLTRDEIYFGYIFTNTFHNPTSLLLRPLALGLFLLSLRVWTRPSLPGVLAGVVLTVASGLAKPTHLICFVPALALLLAWETWSRAPGKGRWAVAAAALLPAAAVLGWQWWLTNAADGPKTAPVVWAPLRVVFEHTRHSVSWVVVKLILSIVFPLTVAAVYARTVVADRAMRLAWLSFAFGALYTYGFAEAGGRMADGNFLWCGQITSFILFLVSAAFLLRVGRPASPGTRWRIVACSVALLLHLASGIAYFVEFILRERIVY